MENVKKRLEEIKNKSENSGFFFKELLKNIGWKTWSIIALIAGGLIVIIISFLLGMTKKDDKN